MELAGGYLREENFKQLEWSVQRFQGRSVPRYVLGRAGSQCD